MVCILFASKAVWDLWRAPNKRHWWRWGWADFAASVPEVEALRALRLLRLLLIIRVMRSTTRSVHSIATYFNVGRARAVVATVFSLIAVSVVMSSVLILGMEGTHPEANIRTAENILATRPSIIESFRTESAADTVQSNTSIKTLAPC